MSQHNCWLTFLALRLSFIFLSDGRYIDFKEPEEDRQAFDEKVKQLTATLIEQMKKATELDEAIKKNPTKTGYGF